jgi:hypothetical protein
MIAVVPKEVRIYGQAAALLEREGLEIDNENPPTVVVKS